MVARISFEFPGQINLYSSFVYHCYISDVDMPAEKRPVATNKIDMTMVMGLSVFTSPTTFVSIDLTELMECLKEFKYTLSVMMAHPFDRRDGFPSRL